MAPPDDMEKSGSPGNIEKAKVDNGEETGESSTMGPAKASKKFPNYIMLAWKATGLDKITILLMLKGALPPVIAIAALQTDAFAEKYSTLGYLCAIMALLSFSIMPRAKFTQTMILNILSVCVCAATTLVQLVCVITARKRTTPPASSAASAPGASGSTEVLAYNAAASTTAAVGLAFNVSLANFARAKRPQLQFPCILYCIFTVVASTSVPKFPTMTVGMAFVNRLLQTFLTGFGIGAGVSFFVLPMTSRMIVSKQMAGFLHLLDVSLKAHGKYMSSMSSTLTSHIEKQNEKAKEVAATENAKGEKAGHHHHHHHLHLPHLNGHQNLKQSRSEMSAEAAAMKQALLGTGALFGKIHAEIPFAKREVAYGKLGPQDFTDLQKHLRDILLPVVGMTTFINIMESVKEHKTAEKEMVDSEETLQAIKNLETEEWEELISISHGAFKRLNEAMQTGLMHASLVLEFVPKPKKGVMDEEKQSDVPSPGDPKFAAYFANEIREFYDHRKRVMQDWCARKGIMLPNSFWDEPPEHPPTEEEQDLKISRRQRENKQQLYLVLYVEYLTWSISTSIEKLVLFADGKVADGTMKKKRLIIPGWKRIIKWAGATFSRDDTEDEIDNSKSANVWVGDSLRMQKDPEHLPPTNAYEKVTDAIRFLPTLLQSPESAFALRAAIATLSLGVLAYLRPTQTFFGRQRVIWALIMIAISMTAHAGQGIFGFFCKIIGTIIAMVMALVVWYVGDQKTAAIIPLLYIYICFGMWFLIKNPQLAVVGIISSVTTILIVGYELQTKKLGLKAAEASGQPFYAVYIFAPYRLAAVCAGLFVAFCWTYFPYPVTTHGTIRTELGDTLYLLANYYSCIHTTLTMRLRDGNQYDDEKKGSPHQKLAKARHKVFSKTFIMMNKLRDSINFERFEPTFGGKFPKQKYEDIQHRMRNVFNYMSLIAYSSRTFTTDPAAEESGWLRDFRKLAGGMKLTSHDLTSTLCLLSASVKNSQPLPPYLRAPKPYKLADNMEAFDPEILSVRHVSEPCYAAFAVLQIASSLLAEEMAHVIKSVQELVGEVDFSFHIISTSEDSDSATTASGSTLWQDDGNGSDRKGKKE